MSALSVVAALEGHLDLTDRFGVEERVADHRCL